MLLVGLTGGYATGKSFVAAELEGHGCRIIYADRLGHAVLEPDGEAYAPAVRLFGDGILKPDRTIDRKQLGATVFLEPERLAQLTALVHPAVFRLEEQLISAYSQTEPAAIIVIEAAILIESGRHARFRRLILTTCAMETQVMRGMRRDGLTREQALARIARQMTLEEKRPYADFVIDTDGTKEETVRQVGIVFQELRRLASGSVTS